MKRFIYILVAVALLCIIASMMVYRYLTCTYSGVEKRVDIPSGVTESEFRQMLVDSLDRPVGDAVYRIWKLRNGSLGMAHGSYIVRPGDGAYRLAMRLRGGVQDPINVVIPNMRDANRCIDLIAAEFEFESDALASALDSVLEANGMDGKCLPAVILPDSYQYYWTASAGSVAESIFKQWLRFWTDDRRAKAEKLKLTPLQVSILASIVEEESAKIDERPRIARLYLNRLDRGMKLQADPTVKYSVGDWSLRRILNTHLSTVSPYNTYIIDGLPPSPIRMVDKSSIDAVLNAPVHKYLYMCAKEDFSGYHNFATTLAEHNANARRYHDALNKRAIK